MKEAILYTKKKDKSVQCYLCRRMCKIKPGERGYCHVRENQGGTLYSLPYGKAVAVNVDPIEKKPFYHFLPGADCFSFSTVGCNFRCLYCFPPGTIVLNDLAPRGIEEVFEDSIETEKEEVRVPEGKTTVSGSGKRKKIEKAFRHRYSGELIGIKPSYTPPIECTPNHGMLVWNGKEIIRKEAGVLAEGDFLVVPKLKPEEGKNLKISIDEILGKRKAVLKKSRKTNEALLREILRMKREGRTSRQIGEKVGMHPVYLRKLMGELKREGISEKTFFYPADLVKEGKWVRFKSEKKGIPSEIEADEEFAELLGYYVAEGSVVESKKRPNSFYVNFSFGRKERHLAERAAFLLDKIFGLKAVVLERRTTISASVGSSSLGVLLKELGGKGAAGKKVPGFLFKSPKNIIDAYLKAYIEGDGTDTVCYIAMNTVSNELAIGTYYLLLKLGCLPCFHKWIPPERKIIEGRVVKQSPLYYVKLNKAVFGEALVGRSSIPTKVGRKGLRFLDCGDFWAVPVQKLWKRSYSGFVYNLEVDDEHTYLANFVGVHNCQNWEISQAYSGIIGEEWSPERIVDYTAGHKIPGIAYTYTEPTIFMEYSLDTAKLAHKKDIFNVFVTNGYESDAAIAEMKGRIDASRIDLKGFSDKIYRDVCGDVDLEGVLATIKGLYKIGHIELINLIVPGYNDNEDDIRAVCKWTKELDPNIPMHFIAFYPSNKMMDVPRTKLETLLRAREIAMEEGLKFAYSGNIENEETESTYCPKCKEMLVRRRGFAVIENKVKGYNSCPECGEKLYFVNNIKEYWKKNGKRTD